MSLSNDPMAEKLLEVAGKSEKLWARLRQMAGHEVKASDTEDGLNQRSPAEVVKQTDANLDESLQLVAGLAEAQAKATQHTAELEAKLQNIEDDKKAAAEREARDPNRWRPGLLWTAAAEAVTLPVLASQMGGDLSGWLWTFTVLQSVIGAIWLIKAFADVEFPEKATPISKFFLTFGTMALLATGIAWRAEQTGDARFVRNSADNLMQETKDTDDRLFTKGLGFSMCKTVKIQQSDGTYAEKVNPSSCYLVSIKDVKDQTNGSAVKAERATVELVGHRDNAFTGEPVAVRGDAVVTRHTAPDGKAFRILDVH
jgi:hypothetical protein